MRRPHFRVRTLMAIVGVAALLLWGSRMAARSYEYTRRAREYGAHERGWVEIASRGRWDAKFASECAGYYSGLARKYRRAAWRPWRPVDPDPHAPGYDRWVEQEDRKKNPPRTRPRPAGGA